MTVRSPRELAAALNRAPHTPYVPTSERRMTGPAVLDPPAASRRVTAADATPLVESPVARGSFAERIRQADAREEVLVFRLGRERFALELASVDEALDWTSVHCVPETPSMLLGVADLRGQLLAVYAPGDVLSAPADGAPAVLLVVRTPAGRIGLAVDDVEEVHLTTADALLDAPSPAGGDALLIGVTRRGGELVSVLDADALVDACLSRRLEEPAA